MSRVAVVERVTFAAGEIAPELRQRTDLARTGTAVKFLENMVVRLKGGATRRPGTAFIIALKDMTQAGLLIPFRFAVNDVFFIVFNAGVMRLIANGGVVLSGGVPYELAIPYAAADLPNIRFAQSGNLVFLACDGYQPRVLTRNGSDTNWTIAAYAATGGPVDTQNLNQAITIQANAATGAITLTGTGTGFDAGLVGGTFKLGMANLSDVQIWQANDGHATGVGNVRQYQGQTYKITALNGAPANCGSTPPTATDGSQTMLDSTGGASLTWTFQNPNYGYVTITGYTSATSISGTLTLPSGATTWVLPADVVSGPTYRWFPPAWSADAGWPNRVMAYQNRLAWARGNKFWFTTSGNFYDFDYTALPNSAINGQLLSDTGALITVEWLAQSGAGVVMVGGHDGEYLLSGSSPNTALTATNIQDVPDQEKGSCPQIPIRAEGGVVFISRDRRRLYHTTYQPLAQRGDPDEISLWSDHMLAPKAVRLAWQADPQNVAWGICQDGSLFSFTFSVKQQVKGFARHPLANGFVEDIAAAQAGDDTSTQVCMIVRRVINGQTVRYIEMLQPYFDNAVETATAAGAWFLDCASQYTGSPVTTISGLGYLQGETVYAHTDGYMQGPFTVSAGGQIVLGSAASNVVVGKAIPYRLRTLAMDVTGQAGSSKGARQTAHQVTVDMLNAGGGTIAVNPDQYAQWDDMELTGDVNYGAAIPLYTGMKRYALQAASDTLVTVEIKGSDTMPMTILGITPYVAIEET